MKKPLEQRSYSFEISSEDTDKGSRIGGRPIVYNSRTDLGPFDEIIDSGALDKESLIDVRFLVNHDTSKIPLARSRKNTRNSTMRLKTVPQGLDFEADLDTNNNASAKELVSAIKRGDITGMSFMFSVDSDEWENLESEHPTRHIKKIGSVVEISAVTFPAYEATSIYARSKEALENARSAVETARQQSVRSVETDAALRLLQEKTKIIGGLYEKENS